MNSQETTRAWGTYAPTFGGKLLRLLVQTGLSHGLIKKKLLTYWKHLYGHDVDITIRGIKYRLNIHDNVTDGKILIGSGEYDKTEIDYLVSACQNGVFVDLGANIGYYSLALASRGAHRVVAVEPNPVTVKRLEFNVSINCLEDVIAVVPLGVGEEGESSLTCTGGLGGASLAIKPADGEETVSIHTRPLIDILNNQGVENIAGLKIDVEGFEDRALMPFFLHAPKSMWPTCIIIEDCHSNLWEYDLLTWLLESGYRLIHKTRGNSILQLQP